MEGGDFIKSEYLYLIDIQEQLGLNRPETEDLLISNDVSIVKIGKRLCVPLAALEWRLMNPTKGMGELSYISPSYCRRIRI